MHIGLAVKSIMVLRGLKQSELARRLGVAQAEVSRKMGKADWRWSDVERYAKALDISAEKIMQRASD